MTLASTYSHKKKGGMKREDERIKEENKKALRLEVARKPQRPEGFFVFLLYPLPFYFRSLPRHLFPFTPKNSNPLWYNKTMNEKESRISKENRMIRKANYELDKENNELKRRVKELEVENKRLDDSVRALKDELFKLMVENGELKRRN